MSRFVTAVLAFAATVAAAAQPQVRWVEMVHDFGAFNESVSKATAVFKGVNTGNEPLVIMSARANCGCTTPTFTREVVQPGDTAFVTVVYNADGRPGRFNKKVYVETNTNPARSTLTVKGVVIGKGETVSQRYPVSLGALKVTRPSVLLGTATRGHATTAFLNGYNQSADSLTAIFSDVPAWLSVTSTPTTVGPGELAQFSFFVRADKTDLYGIVTDTVTVKVCPTGGNAATACTEHRLPVVVTFADDFSGMSDKELALSPVAELSTKRIALENLPLGKPHTATVTIRNTGKSTLHIRRAYTADTDIRVQTDARAVKPGKSATLKITVTPGAPLLNGRVSVITDDPLNPVQTVAVTAAAK